MKKILDKVTKSRVKYGRKKGSIMVASMHMLSDGRDW
jgi:hypothetical protein